MIHLWFDSGQDGYEKKGVSPLPCLMLQGPAWASFGRLRVSPNQFGHRDEKRAKSISGIICTKNRIPEEEQGFAENIKNGLDSKDDPYTPNIQQFDNLFNQQGRHPSNIREKSRIFFNLNSRHGTTDWRADGRADKPSSNKSFS